MVFLFLTLAQSLEKINVKKMENEQDILPKIHPAAFIGAYIWCTLPVGAGYVPGHKWMLISFNFKQHIPLSVAPWRFLNGRVSGLSIPPHP
jgi:hypothetical protein